MPLNNERYKRNHFYELWKIHSFSNTPISGCPSQSHHYDMPASLSPSLAAVNYQGLNSYVGFNNSSLHLGPSTPPGLSLIPGAMA